MGGVLELVRMYDRVERKYADSVLDDTGKKIKFWVYYGNPVASQLSHLSNRLPT